MRRILPVLALCVLGFVGNSGPASADVTYPWCAQYDGRRGGGGGRNCGFWTFDQCMATVSGIGGFCEPNAMYRGRQPGQIPPPPWPPRRFGYY
jgi:hypothetical protein